MNPSEIRVLESAAAEARSAKLSEVQGLYDLAGATQALLDLIYGYINREVAAGSHVGTAVCDHREQLEPLANSLGFSLQPSPTYVGQFVIVPWSKA